MIHVNRPNWLPKVEGKVWIFGIFEQKKFFLHISRTEKFPLVTRRNCSKSSLDPKRGSEFTKEYSLTGFKKISYQQFLFPLSKLGPSSPKGKPKGTGKEKLLNITDLIPGRTSDHKKTIQYKIQALPKRFLRD